MLELSPNFALAPRLRDFIQQQPLWRSRSLLSFCCLSRNSICHWPGFRLIDHLEVAKAERLVEECLLRCVQAEIDEPAVTLDRLHVIHFETCRRLGANEEIDAAIVIVLEILHRAVEIDAADFRTTVIIGTARVFAVQSESPELTDWHFCRNVQLISLVCPQRSALAVAFGGHIDLSNSRRRIDHAVGACHGFIKPRGSLIELEAGGNLLRNLKVEALIPVRALPVRFGVARIDLQVAVHQPTHCATLFKGQCLASIRLEWLSLLDSQWYQHGHPGF